MTYKTVVFDLDGTLIDSYEGIAKAFQQALLYKGVQESIETIKSLIGPPLYRTIITRYGFTEAEGKEAMKRHRDYLKEKGIYECSVFEGVEEMLQSLSDAGITLAIASNKPDYSTFAQLDHLGLSKFFTSIVCNNEDQTRGTKSDFIRIALEECGVKDKSAAIMVGDRGEDIQCGKENGLDTIGVLYGYGTKEEMREHQPTYVVKSPADVRKIILPDH